MSSLEEERLVQMVEDFIESESPSPIFSASSKSLPRKHHAQYLTLQVQVHFLFFKVIDIFWFWFSFLCVDNLRESKYHFLLILCCLRRFSGVGQKLRLRSLRLC
jgi:hypothetical protein